MRRFSTLTAGMTIAAGLSLGGCSLIADLLGLNALNLLGVMPYSGFSQQASPDFGKAVFALSSEDTAGFTLSPPLGLLTFEDENGDPIEVEEGEEIPGADAGTFVLLVDGSSSMLQTDPARHRVDAAVMVAERVAQCSTHFDQALLEFTTDASSGKYMWSRMHADFGASPGEIAEVVEQLSANGGTPLWDATAEVIGGLSEHADGHEAELDQLAEEGAQEDPQGADPGAGDGPSNGPGPGDSGGAGPDLPVDYNYARTLVVISDGADSGSYKSLDAVIDQASAAGIRVHAIGLGPASDAETDFTPEMSAIEDLRRLALETGGTYGYVGLAAELPTQADAIAKAVCGGYTEVEVRFANPKARGERVHGKVSLLDTDLGLPFSFTAP